MKKKTTTKRTAKKKTAQACRTQAPDLANRAAYYSMGIDAHKAFCQVHVLTPEGGVYWKGRINRPDWELFTDLVQGMDAPCKAVFESAMNWHVLHDFLTGIDGLEEVKMAHPLKVKLICDAQLKNDKVDAMRLAQLLRLDMIPEAHACSPEARATKELESYGDRHFMKGDSRKSLGVKGRIAPFALPQPPQAPPPAGPAPAGRRRQTLCPGLPALPPPSQAPRGAPSFRRPPLRLLPSATEIHKGTHKL